ncbi:hypothetical protein D9M68_965860 [compost metagenome]
MRIAKRKLAKIGGAILAALLLLWFVGRLLAWGSCSWYGYQTERDTRYAAFIGCMVEVDGKWYPRSELRVVQ